MGAQKEELPTRVEFPFTCATCPGDGVVRPARPGVDWPTPCECKSRRVFTNYQLARRLEESPKAIVRVSLGRATTAVCLRVLRKLDECGLLREGAC